MTPALLDSAPGLTRRQGPPEVTLAPLRTPDSTDREQEAPALAVVISSRDGAAVVDELARNTCAELGVDLDQLISNESAKGDAGSVLVVPLARAERPWRVFVVGVGEGQAADWRSAGAATARRAGSLERLALVADADADRLAAFVEGLTLASYRLPSPLPDSDDGSRDPARSNGGLGAVVIRSERSGEPAVAESIRRARVVAEAVWLARDLINMPSLVKTPRWLADQAVHVGTAAGLSVTVLGPDELAAQGFGALVAVGEGSARPPCLVVLSYTGPEPQDGRGPGHRVLVGKGITFDSGGLSLKPAGSMTTMKTDMSGAAAVLATMAALPALGVPGRVTGLLCLAENMIGGSALRPGDVITCWGGTTVEVLNTDAEGRLVLADGLAYAAGTLDPDVIIDLATLTGAISIALGRRTAGLFASDDTLARELSAAAEAAGERVWRLPLVEEYRPAIDSPVADLMNTGSSMDVSGGSITAALFLREFTGGRPWAHLDIAGTARSDSDDGEINRGGTGWGVRTLLAYLAR